MAEGKTTLVELFPEEAVKLAPAYSNTPLRDVRAFGQVWRNSALDFHLKADATILGLEVDATIQQVSGGALLVHADIRSLNKMSSVCVCWCFSRIRSLLCVAALFRHTRGAALHVAKVNEPPVLSMS